MSHSRPCSQCNTMIETDVPSRILIACDACQIKENARYEAEKVKMRFDELMIMGLLWSNTWNCKFETSDPEKEKASNPDAWAYGRTDFAGNVFLWGSEGVGKTWLGRCILMRCVARYISAAEVSAPTYIRDAQDFKETKITKMRQSTPILLFDDLDKVPLTKSALSKLWELFDVRSTCKRQTIITANMDKKGLSKYLEQAVPENTSLVRATLDRLNPCETFEMIGTSLRKKEVEG